MLDKVKASADRAGSRACMVQHVVRRCGAGVEAPRESCATAWNFQLNPKRVSTRLHCVCSFTRVVRIWATSTCLLALIHPEFSAPR